MKGLGRFLIHSMSLLEVKVSRYVPYDSIRNDLARYLGIGIFFLHFFVLLT